MKTNCFIVQDLIPLYNENLLNPETEQWVNTHLESCAECRELLEVSSLELTAEPIKNNMDQEVMFKKINRKLSMYQITFVALSFFIAINTSLLNESFGFILWYPALGALTYLFYKDIKLVFLLSFMPIFIWSFGSNTIDFVKGYYMDTTIFTFLLENLIMSFIPAIIHFIFAALGGLIGYLIELIKK